MRLIRLRTCKYHKQRSFRRLLSWIDFEYRLLTVPKTDLPRPDVIIASSLSLLTIISGLLLGMRYRCKVIFEVRDIWPLTLTEEGGFSRANPLIFILACVEWIGYRLSDAIVGTMPNLAEHVRAVVAVAPPVHCVPMGFQEAQASPQAIDRTPVRTGCPPQARFVVGYAGSMGVSNALETLFRCAECLSHDSRIHFMVMGEGDLRPDYESRFNRLSNLTFLQPCPRGEVTSFLDSCHVLYFATQRSSIWRFGQSLNKIVDYMLAGKPIIGSYSGYLTMINEAECGSVVPAEDIDALRREILRYQEMTPQVRAEIGGRGRTWVLANRQYEVLTADYFAVLQGLGAEKPGAGVYRSAPLPKRVHH
jgi:glycosyltransferase involved in cell wall biosynthesis